LADSIGFGSALFARGREVRKRQIMAVAQAMEYLRDGYLDNAYYELQELAEEMDKEPRPKTQEEFYNELRNGVIEEVAKEMEKMKGFGQDTISSLAIYIRSMKK